MIHNAVKNAKTLIVGLGATGMSVARFLKYNNMPFIVADSRDKPPFYQDFCDALPEVPLYLGEFKEEVFLSAQNIILSPGVSSTTQAIAAAKNIGIPVFSDIELFARYVNPQQPVLAITGSNGKSTVTTLVAEMMKYAGYTVAVGGNLGPPALDLMLNQQETDVYVLELSSFQLETVKSLKATASIILNISEDHMDRYSSIGEYIKVKLHIHRNSRAIIMNREENLYIPSTSESALISFGTGIAEEGNFGLIDIDHEQYIAYGEEPWIMCKELSHLPGITGILNAQAALAMGHTIGLDTAIMLDILRNFKGLSHRYEVIGELDGVEWINDSKATNIAAAIAALKNIKKSCVWIAGGDGKSGDFSKMAAVVNEKVHTALLFGRDAEKIAQSIQDTNVQVIVLSDLETAMHKARQYAQVVDSVLLAPACSSLDMYDDYAARGQHFVTVFQELCHA